MKVGSFTIELLSEGRFEVFKDGHINRSPLEEEADFQTGMISGQSSMVGINPVLVKTGPHNILIDTGLGWGLDSGSNYQNVSNIHTNLDIFGLNPDDITHVILSHLHYDHAAGSSFTNADSETKASFPNATYFVHEKEWEFSLSQTDQSEVGGAGYRLDDFYRLIADNQVELLKEDSTQILKGITILWTGGHTPGHQIVQLQSDDKFAYYFGDLLSSSLQLNDFEANRRDIDPVQAKKKRIQLLKKAHREKAVLLFYHSTNIHSGRLTKTKDEQYTLEEISSF